METPELENEKILAIHNRKVKKGVCLKLKTFVGILRNDLFYLRMYLTYSDNCFPGSKNFQMR